MRGGEGKAGRGLRVVPVTMRQQDGLGREGLRRQPCVEHKPPLGQVVAGGVCRPAQAHHAQLVPPVRRAHPAEQRVRVAGHLRARGEGF